jgi:hypothetical protein
MMQFFDAVGSNSWAVSAGSLPCKPGFCVTWWAYLAIQCGCHWHTVSDIILQPRVKADGVSSETLLHPGYCDMPVTFIMILRYSAVKVIDLHAKIGWCMGFM